MVKVSVTKAGITVTCPCCEETFTVKAADLEGDGEVVCPNKPVCGFRESAASFSKRIREAGPGDDVSRI